jgi:hypothetical protein
MKDQYHKGIHDTSEISTSKGFRSMSDVHRIDDPKSVKPLQTVGLFFWEFDI